MKSVANKHCEELNLTYQEHLLVCVTVVKLRAKTPRYDKEIKKVGMTRVTFQFLYPTK